MTKFTRGAVVGGIAGAFVAAATIALAGTGVGGIFNLGQENTVNAQTSLKGSVAGNAPAPRRELLERSWTVRDQLQRQGRLRQAQRSDGR